MKKFVLLFAIWYFSLILAGSLPAVTHTQDNSINPDKALAILLKGNQRFVKGQVVRPHQSAENRVKTAKEGQKPIAAILGCSDSRVPPEMIFDAGLGDIFVVRLAGNVTGKEVLGSLEYAVEHLGVKLILVLGHTKCGAVTAVAKQEKVTGNLIAIANEIKPAVDKTKAAHKDLAVEKLILESIKANVQQSIDKMLSSSSLLRERLQAGDIKIVGGLYDLETGAVAILTLLDVSQVR
ncbi:MAG: carbonic anhydrase [Candidatus Margulisiibacteriota bacterium]